MAFVPYPTTPDELITLLIADYPSKETIIRSEVGWQHLNDRKVLADFFDQRLDDRARAEETINLGLNLKTQVQDVLGMRDYSDYLGPNGELPSVILDFENNVYARKRGGVLRETHPLSELPTGVIVTGDDGIRRLRLNAADGDTPVLDITDLDLSTATFVCHFEQDNTVGAFERIWQLDDGTENNAIRLWLHSTEEYRFSVQVGGVSQTNIAGSEESVGPLMSRVVCSWTDQDYRISMNGVKGLKGGGSIPSFDTLRLGHKVAGDKQPDGGIERLVIFEEQLAYDDMTTMSRLVRRFVDVTLGTDSGDALTEASPWQSPEYAAVNADPGDMIYFRAGTYEPFEINASGTRFNYLSFLAYPGETVTIDGGGDAGAPGTGGAYLSGIRAIGRSFIRVAGMLVQDLTDTHTGGKKPNGIEFLGSSTGFNQIGIEGIRIAKNTINNSRASAISCLGYSLTPASQPPVVDSRIPIGLIRDLRIDSNTIGAHNLLDGVVEGISVGGGLKNFDISRNVMSASRQYGIDAKAGAEDGVISFNVISGQTNHGIYIDTGRWYCRRILIFGNQVDSCGDNGIVLTRETGDVNPDHILEDIDIIGNLIRDNDERAILIYPHVTDGDALADARGQFRRILVAHNTITGHTAGAADGIRIGPLGKLGTEITLANNICFGNSDNISVDATMAAKVSLIANVTTDPSFLNAGGNDYRIASDSVARGVANLDYVPDFDLIGVPRRDTSTPDAGAYEYEEGAAPIAETHVFVLAGQSNMIGRADFDGGTGYPSGTLQYNQAGSVVAATTPLDHTGEISGDFGLCVQFAIDYKAANPNATLVFVPCAQGGTGFNAGQWGVGTSLSNAVINRTNALMAANPDFLLKGILWHQGESDAGNDDYVTQLDAQLEAFRSDINEADSSTPIVVGGLLPSWLGTDADRLAVQGTLLSTPDRLAYTAFAASTGLSGVDSVHFNAAGLRTLGSRYYTALVAARTDSSVNSLIETGAVGHWLFGSDNTDDADMVSARVASGPAPSRSTGYLTTASGNMQGLDSGIEEAPEQTICYVFRTTADGQCVFGGALVTGGSDGMSPFVSRNVANNSINYNMRGGWNNRVLAAGRTDSSDFIFVAVSKSTDSGAYAALAGNDPTSDTDSGTSSMTTSTRNVGIGNLHYNNISFSTPVELAEVIIFNDSKDLTELEAIYQRSKTRLSARSITVE